MKTTLARVLFVLVCTTTAPSLAASAAVEEDAISSSASARSRFSEVERMLAEAYVKRGAAAFSPVSEPAKASFREAFGLLLGEAAQPGASAPSKPALKLLSELGFRFETLQVAGQSLWAVLEQRHRQRGGGLYLIRPGLDAGAWTNAPATASGVTRTVLMVPHPRSDKGTDILGQRLFMLSRARAYLQATVDRKTSAPDGTTADPAHRADTYFQAATDALDAHTDGQLFLQLHGFESLKHTGKLSAGTGVVISDGTGSSQPRPAVAAAAAYLRKRHPGDFVAVYGESSRRLGGTTNTQARSINEHGRNTFLHLEMAGAVREDGLDASARPRPPPGSFLDSLVHVVGWQDTPR